MSIQETNRAIPLSIRRTGLDRKTAFSFSCMRCLQCCRSKKIQVNPYEIARLAQNLGISTTECLARYITEEGPYLKFDEKNSCLFLGPEGCLVHSDRPLVCRLYPLGRHLNELNEEWFSEVEPDAECRGECGEKRSLESYLESQESDVYLLAANSYLNLLWKMMLLLENSSDDEENGEEQESSGDDKTGMFENNNWMDMDAAVQNYCQERQIPLPPDIEGKMRLHQEALQCWIQQS